MREAGDTLAERGLAGMDLADIAARAEVGKTTVYRRWGTVAGLIADVLQAMAESSQPRTDHGSLLADLEANAQLVQRTLVDKRQGRLFQAAIAAAVTDPVTAEALQKFYAIRIAEWAPCVQAAIDREEIPSDTDPAEVIRAVSAPLYYRLLVSGDPLTEDEAQRAARAAYAAAQAGAYELGSGNARSDSH